MNKNFEIIFEESSIDTIPKYEEYKKDIANAIIVISLVAGSVTILVLYMILLVGMILLWLIALIATLMWENKKIS